MNFSSAFRIPRHRTWLNIAAALVLAPVVWGLAVHLGAGRSGVEIASASSAPKTGASAGQSDQMVKKQYARALALYYTGDFRKARELFVNIAPHVPGHLVDDIHFWQAECAFRLGDLKSAENGFKSFLNQGTQGPRTEIALNRLTTLTLRSN